MSVIGSSILAGASGAAGGGGKVYVDDVFSTYVYPGDGQNPRNINNGIDLAGEGGLVWVKARNLSEDHIWVDTERGATNRLWSNSSNAQVTNGGTVKGFNNNGFQIDSNGYVNGSTGTYASWTFRKAPGFFDVVTYTGTGSARTVAHSLGSVPGMIIIKQTSATESWYVYHRSIGNDKHLILSSGNPEANSSAWNDTTPTSTNFTVSNDDVNQNNETYVAYIFAHDDASFGTDEDESIIKCGTYTGTGAANNTVNLGFEPQWVMLKSTSSGNTQPWFLLDNMRGAPTGSDTAYIFANETNTEATFGIITFNATGFAVEATGAGTNGSGQNYIYMAIRRPHKPPEAATEVFAIDTGNGSSTIPCWDSGFPVDFAIWSKPNDTYHKGVGARLLGTKYLKSNETQAEATDPDLTWDSNVGWGKAYASTFLSYMFKRAPGFIDVVAYVGDGSNARQINHNLDQSPELIICKKRSATGNWAVYHKDIPIDGSENQSQNCFLNSDSSAGGYGVFAGPTHQTATQFRFRVGGDASGFNDNTATYIAYLFATLPGISKVGSYSGTGSANNIDCGFTAGARFVLIKRTDSSGDWFVFDTTRGMVSGNDYFLKLNTNGAQVGGDDYIDPYAAGFTINGTYSGLNASGGTYVFLAIA